jgi:hypothetical protein
MMLSTAAVAVMNPVLTDRAEYLHHYAYALNLWAHKAEGVGKTVYAQRLRRRAYYLRTLAR